MWRRLLVMLLAVAPISAAAPGHAGRANGPTIGQFHGIANIPNFGSDAGGSDGTFSGVFTGIANGVPVAHVPLYASYSYWQHNASCPLIGFASGNAAIPSVGYIVGFNWAREGTHVIITTSDGGVGQAELVAVVDVPCPPQGQNISATVAGALVEP